MVMAPALQLLAGKAIGLGCSKTLMVLPGASVLPACITAKPVLVKIC